MVNAIGVNCNKVLGIRHGFRRSRDGVTTLHSMNTNKGCEELSIYYLHDIARWYPAS